MEEGDQGHQEGQESRHSTGHQQHQGGNLPVWGGKGEREHADVRVEKQLHGASSAGARASDWEQDSHRDREKWSAVTQDGLSRATTSRLRARNTQSSAMSLKGRNTNTSFTDMLPPPRRGAAGRSHWRSACVFSHHSTPLLCVCTRACVSSWKSLTGDIRLDRGFQNNRTSAGTRDKSLINKHCWISNNCIYSSLLLLMLCYLYITLRYPIQACVVLSD
ncbi:hypothetical protein EYF80_056180 [Liparis tanakae]|uniref:Uncharacterized protein n=1 Tax=Liparis tanakae TaxID=230148 RepID=A0A4Z2EXJ0_9TELE|nr:hypothetical protein EYF80_056180 [Liparis tanakae]